MWVPTPTHTILSKPKWSSCGGGGGGVVPKTIVLLKLIYDNKST